MNRKIFIITISMLIILSYNLKAANLALNFTTQFAITGANTNSKIFPSEFRDFDTGFAFSIGLNQPFSSSMSLSLLLDLGYYHDSFDLKYIVEDGKRATENYQFDSFLIGGYARFNFGFISLGAGGGAKIPGSATYKLNSPDKYRFYRFSFGDLNDIFTSAVIPYVRASVDFCIFNYLLVGIYANYDFPIKFQYNNYMSDTFINKNSLSSFDIGIQFGYYLNINFNKYNY